MKTGTLRSMSVFTLITLAVLAALMLAIPTLHFEKESALLLLLTPLMHFFTAGVCYLAEDCLYGNTWYKKVAVALFAMFAFILWLAFLMSHTAPGLPMQFFFLTGASGILNGLGILIFRLHVPATRKVASGEGGPTQAA
jgi:hypothetical protein